MIDLTIENGTAPLRELDGLGALGNLGFTWRPEYLQAAEAEVKSQKMKKWLLIGGGSVAAIILLALVIPRR